jgi:hypothetical protein
MYATYYILEQARAEVCYDLVVTLEDLAYLLRIQQPTTSDRDRPCRNRC